MPLKDIVLNSKDRVVPPKNNKPVRNINRQVKRPVRDLEDALNDHPEGIWLAARNLSSTVNRIQTGHRRRNTS